MNTLKEKNAVLDTEKKNEVLWTLAELLDENRKNIIQMNEADMLSCGEIDESLIDRLKVDENKVSGMIQSVHNTIKLDDPEGKVLDTYEHENGLKMENKTVPFGKILIIYESRPDVTIEAAIVAFKAGNKILLKGGKEAKETNKYLVFLWEKALLQHGLNRNYVTYLDISREAIQKLIKENNEKIDIIIPRGGEGLINFVRENSNIPTIISGRGNNFLYVDRESDFDMATNIVVDGKKRLSVCNALDKVLIHKDIQDIEGKVSQLVKELKKDNIEVLGDEEISRINNEIQLVKDDAILAEEFLSPKIYLSLVESSRKAIDIINSYSGGHSATIVSLNNQTAEVFQKEADCAAVYHNASTRFTDGGQFGFGAEIAISTQKLHARGPIGLDQLVTNKWFIYGSGQVRS